MIVYIITAAVCAAFSVLFFLGKGTLLARGTAGAANDEMFFDAEKLRFVCGGGMALLTVLFVLSAVFSERILFWLPMAISTAICTALVLLCNTVCALPQPEPWYRRTAGMFFLGFLVALIFALTLFGKGGTITVTAGAENFTVRGNFFGEQTVAYDRVTSLTLETGWENGTRLRGVESNRLCEGRFRNKQAGDYTMYAYTQCDARILVRTADQALAFNAPTAAETKALYDQLSERVKTDAAQ